MIKSVRMSTNSVPVKHYSAPRRTNSIPTWTNSVSIRANSARYPVNSITTRAKSALFAQFHPRVSVPAEKLYLLPFVLELVEFVVDSALGEELLMVALLDYLALVHHENSVNMLNGR